MSSPAASFTAPLPASPVTLFSISPRQWLILLTVTLSTLLFGMTITLANVVLPQIRGALSATQDEISWVITLNLVATAVATPMTPWLADADVQHGARICRIFVPLRDGDQPGVADPVSRLPGFVRRADHADGTG